MWMCVVNNVNCWSHDIDFQFKSNKHDFWQVLWCSDSKNRELALFKFLIFLSISKHQRWHETTTTCFSIIRTNKNYAHIVENNSQFPFLITLSLLYCSKSSLAEILFVALEINEHKCLIMRWDSIGIQNFCVLVHSCSLVFWMMFGWIADRSCHRFKIKYILIMRWCFVFNSS